MTEQTPPRLGVVRCPNGCRETQAVKTSNPWLNCRVCGTRMAFVCWVADHQPGSPSFDGADAYEAYHEDIERRASALWRSENPDQSVFDCDAETKARYRERVQTAYGELTRPAGKEG